MLNVTTRAKDVLRDALDQRGIDGEDVAYRLRVMRDKNSRRKRFGLTLDRPQDGDQVVEHGGRKVLLVGVQISATLDGTTLKAVDTSRGWRLRIER